MPFWIAVILIIFMVGVFVTIWVIAGLQFAAKDSQQRDTGQDDRLRRMEAELADLREMVQNALIEQDDPRWRELDAASRESLSIDAR